MKKLIALGAALLALVLGPAPAVAQALTPETIAVLGAPNPCANVPFKADFIAGAYCLNGVRYASVDKLPGYSFTRSSVAYCQRVDLTWVSVASGVPCITDRGFSSWELRTNVELRSQTFDNAGWAKVNITVAADVVAAPDGTMTADRLTRASNATSYAGNNFTAAGFVAGDTVTVSAFAKANSIGNQVGLRLQGTYPDRADAVFDLTTCDVRGSPGGTTYTSISARAVAQANGWCWISVTATSVTTAPTGYFIGPTDNSATVAAWEGATGVLSDVYLWNAQTEKAAYAGPPILTTSGAAARQQDVMFITGLSAIVNYPVTVKGVWTIESQDGADLRVASISDGTTANRVTLTRNSTNAGSVFANTASVAQSGPAQVSGKTGARTIAAAGRQRATVTSHSVDGSVAANSSAMTGPTGLTQLDIGRGVSSNQAAGHVRQVAVYGDTTDAQLQNLSQP